MEILDEKSNKEEVVEAYRTAQGLTFQVITKTAFAMDVDCQRDENASICLTSSGLDIITYKASISLPRVIHYYITPWNSMSSLC